MSVDARDLFDGIALRKMGKLDDGASAEVGGDRISTLPDVLLNHVLSFLPAEEAVRTCLLARRWRHLWKFTAGVRFGSFKEELKSVHELQKFVDHFLLLRGGSPLDTCELRIGGFSEDDDVSRVNLWLRHAVMCKVRVLMLNVYGDTFSDPWLELDDLPLVSKTLTRLELCGVGCHASLLDFSSCPALENLHFEFCDLSSAKKISSESIKSLSIIESSLGYDDSRVRISAPNLVSLRLDGFLYKTPILENMPALTGAFVRVAKRCDDRCSKILRPYGGCNCESCESSDSIGDQSNSCVLLKGLSEARSLVLISTSDVFIFKRDLRWCPMFYNLRTLLLNEYWCGPDGTHALACILEHTPNLEKLTLQLFSEGPKHSVEMEGSFSSAVQSAAISKYLKIIEIKCEMVDERVAKVLKFLCTFNIRFSF